MKRKFELLNGVIIPKKRNRESKYPFPQMKIGNSFIVGTYSTKLQQNVVSAVNRWRKNNGLTARKFSSWKTSNGDLMIKRIK